MAMLILTRKVEESIRIGDGITIKILAVGDGQVKIGIEAPKNLAVHRTEVYEQIQKQNREASQTAKTDVASIAQVLKRQRSEKK